MSILTVKHPKSLSAERAILISYHTLTCLFFYSIFNHCSNMETEWLQKRTDSELTSSDANSYAV